MDKPKKFWYRNVRRCFDGVMSDAGWVIVKAPTAYEAHNKLLKLQDEWDSEAGEIYRIVGDVQELSDQELKALEAFWPVPIYLPVLK